MVSVTKQVSLTKEGLWQFDQPQETTKRKVTQWLVRQRSSVKLINVPPKNGVQLPSSEASIPCTPNALCRTQSASGCDSGVSSDSSATPPAASQTVCRKLNFDRQKAANLLGKRVRSVQANKEKRKRYRCNKKRKYFQRCHSSSDDHQAQDTLDGATPSVADSDSSSIHVGLGPYDVLMDEAKQFKQNQEIKKAELDRKFKSFVDESPCFPDDNPNLKLPQSLSGIDRVEVTYQMKELIHQRKDAQFQARFFRDSCEQLKQKIRQLETEKEGVRYFWRNKVLEGHTRSGEILKLAITPK